MGAFENAIREAESFESLTQLYKKAQAEKSSAEDRLRRVRRLAAVHAAWNEDDDGPPDDMAQGMLAMAQRILAEIDGESGE